MKKILNKYLKYQLGIFILLCLCCSGCYKRKNTYTIARDGDWLPFNFGVQTSNINGLINQVTSIVAAKMKSELLIVSADAETLREGLDCKKFDAAFSMLTVGRESMERYHFSKPILLTGPVLVVRSDSSFRNIMDFSKKIMAVNQADSSISIIASVPDIIISFYEKPVVAIGELLKGRYDGILLPYIEAQQLIQKEFAKEIKIVTDPLTDEGVRLITLKDTHNDLIEAFDLFLQKEFRKRNGSLAQIKRNFFLL
ncbi:Uncharacterized protein CLAVI_000617 [Candidatus Clavichlamydia salmonicola]|uniref:substrate-binding periplasmic protein n=1 Tax=Candidatus Clavichlamydia salmonicola TaxID=469812 RepID=UPI001890F0EA|nr:transporter substrate-binding domain-containing protein [Candidatus Clavichlamydia salmonicola]MBF5050993.1 Uncharacterized protein [Candidatus Clavichlamydia salmonicola]